MLVQHNASLILASTSQVRKKILQESGLKFNIIPPDFNEKKAKKKFPQKTIKELAIFLAEGKALSISTQYPTAYVIGSDQVCEFAEKEIPKSENISEAVSQLKKMNGQTHFQNNSTVIAINGKIIFRNFSRVKLRMRQLSQVEIENYVAADQSFGCAGSYKYESLGKHLFEKIAGDYYSILGLAIQPLLTFLHRKKIITIKSS